VAGEVYRELGEAAWAWVMGQVRGDEGPWLPEVVPADEPPGRPGAGRDSLYAGIGGLAPVLAELGRSRALMADAIADRAIRDQAGVRWRFTEHRQDPPLLPPGTSWMQGAAGIAAFLLRLARVTQDGLTAPVVDRPDQWWAVPARLRTVHTGPQT
jgi:hypothetical protein